MAVADATPMERATRAELGVLHAESNIVAGERNAIVHCLVEWRRTKGKGLALFIKELDDTGKENILGGKEAIPEAARVRNRINLLRHRLTKLVKAIEADPLAPPPPLKKRRGG